MSEQQFEGTHVNDYQAQLPSMKVDCEYYRAGSILRLAIEVRIKGVSYEEDKEGNWVRLHKLGIQDIEVVSAFDPATAQDGVGGSLAGGAPDPDASQDTGLDVGRTADQWPQGVAQASGQSNGRVHVEATGREVDPETGEFEPEQTDEGDAEEPKDEAEPEDPEPDPELDPETDSEAERQPVDVGF